jgi:GDP-4-dehydro-6-deoxy-D-mannose reductase
VSLKRVVELLVGLAGVEVEVQRDDARLRRAEVPVLRGDPTKLKETTGWQPEMPLEQTLADALEAAARAEVVRS